MKFSSQSFWKYWLGILFSAVISIIIVLWFQHPAQILFWFFAVDIVIVAVYVLTQLLRFSSISRSLLLLGGLAVLCTLVSLVLGSVAILVTQNIIDFNSMTINDISLVVPVFASLIAYFYISQTSYFTDYYFDRYKVRVFLLFTFGSLFFGSWVAYSVYSFAILFDIHYFAGFFVYLMYKLAFDSLVYKFFAKRKDPWDYVLRN